MGSAAGPAAAGGPRIPTLGEGAPGFCRKRRASPPWPRSPKLNLPEPTPGGSETKTDETHCVSGVPGGPTRDPGPPPAAASVDPRGEARVGDTAPRVGAGQRRQGPAGGQARQVPPQMPPGAGQVRDGRGTDGPPRGFLGQGGPGLRCHRGGPVSPAARAESGWGWGVGVCGVGRAPGIGPAGSFGVISWSFLCFRRMGLVALAAGLSCVGGWEVQCLECAEPPGCLRVLPWGPSALLLLGPGLLPGEV